MSKVHKLTKLLEVSDNGATPNYSPPLSSTQDLGVAGEDSPRRVYVVPKKKMHASEVAGMISDFVAKRRYGVDPKFVNEFGSFYLSGEFTHFGLKPWDAIENRYRLKPEVAKRLWSDVESHFKHFRLFFDTHDDTEEITVQGKEIQPA